MRGLARGPGALDLTLSGGHDWSRGLRVPPTRAAAVVQLRCGPSHMIWGKGLGIFLGVYGLARTVRSANEDRRAIRDLETFHRGTT